MTDRQAIIESPPDFAHIRTSTSSPSVSRSIECCHRRVLLLDDRRPADVRVLSYRVRGLVVPRRLESLVPGPPRNGRRYTAHSNASAGTRPARFVLASAELRPPANEQVRG
jgi:hypothetical protein